MGDIKEKPSKYWADRQIADVKKTDVEALTALKDIQTHYNKLDKELSNEVAYFYQKYGKDNIIEFSNLRSIASKNDLDMLYKDWEGFAEKYPKYAYLKPVRENMYKLDRYEMLIEKSRYQISELGAKEAEIMAKSLKGTAKSTYANMGKVLSGNVAMLDDLQADKMISTKWISGQNYSDRLWGNKDKLLGHLDYELRNGIIRGDDFDTMVGHLKSITGASKSDAERLIRTETSYVANRSNMQNYIDNGLKFYEYLAVEDSRTSERCSTLDGKVFELSKAQIGINYPPLHPNCRSRGLPVSNRRAKELGLEENAVPSSDKVLKDINEKQYNQYKNALGGIVPDSFDKFVELKYNEDKWNELKSLYRNRKNSTYLERQLPFIDSGQKLFIPTNTIVTNTKSLFGNGTTNKLNEAERLSKIYGGDPLKWAKKVGKVESDNYVIDVHWYSYDDQYKQYEIKYKEGKKK
ncbi:MAG: minor capsid protein [Firmicutes bacterium]|nr:minor capsid protein [Bacillota bacterium]